MNTKNQWIPVKLPSNAMHLIRLCMAIYVALMHFKELTASVDLDWIPDVIARQGRITILGFFIFSGLLITSSYVQNENLKDYFYNRFFRLVPGYIVVILLCAVGLSIISNLDIISYFSSSDLYKYILYNSLFLNFLQPTLPGVFESNPFSSAVNGSLWTMKVEIMFYIALPFFIKFLMKFKSPSARNIVLGLAYLFSYLYVFAVHQMDFFSPEIRKGISLQFPGFINFFAVGIFMYFNFNWIQKNINYLIIPGIILFFERIIFGTLYLTPITFGIIVFYLSFQIKFLQNIKIKSDYSFGIYIYHYPIIQLLISIGMASYNIYLTLIVGSILVFICSYASWNLIEKPYLLRKKRKSI